MKKVGKWQPVFPYSVGDVFTLNDIEQVVLRAGLSGLVEPLWKQERGEYTDDYGVRWECVGKVKEVENDQ